MVTCAYPADLVTPVTLAVFAAHVHEHPLVTHYRATGDSSPVKISDFLSRERFHRLGLYAEFFRHLPVEHQLAVGLPSPDTRVVGIALNRSSGDFTEAGRDLVRRRLVRTTSGNRRARATHPDVLAGDAVTYWRRRGLRTSEGSHPLIQGETRENQDHFPERAVCVPRERLVAHAASRISHPAGTPGHQAGIAAAEARRESSLVGCGWVADI